ncbi:hypothetical protein [Mesorhizobium sp. L-8-3]|uniref:hypothetical protein n=1 Tax=Mesorhizobium sp. L-8-3 TaxID=2744522 RepID=UPI00192742A2|nr:hypothetical protein [Mesorhizobium sp. L-8-3]BCH22258.1 hypothetical protein MesoLjLb_20430 [Mesorhizobium sp. L-8-3]
MRPKLRGLSLLALVGGVVVAGQSLADGRYRDQVHADSFGNLVVYSASGYKRIVVGEGHMAKRLAANTRALVEAPEAGAAWFVWNCPAVLLKGRSYMYGLPEHVVPEPSREFCR